MRHLSGDRIWATHMPKSGITIPDDWSLVWKIMFSGLFTSHVLYPKISMKIGKVDDEGATIPVDCTVIVQTLQAGQDGTRDEEKRTSYLAAITG